MEPGTPEEQEELKLRLAQLNYPWPEHTDDVSVLAHSYEGEDVELTIAAHGVSLKLKDGRPINAALGWETTEPFVVENAFTAAPPVHWQGAAGWKDGKLTMLARTTEGPFMVRGVAVPNEEGLELALEGIGIAERTVQLKKQ